MEKVHEKSKIKYHKITPRWPQANAQAVIQQTTHKSNSHCTSAGSNNFSPHLQECTTHFNTVHSIQTHFDTDPKTEIPDPAGPRHHTVFPKQHADNTQLQRQDAEEKEEMKEYKDTRNHATHQTTKAEQTQYSFQSDTDGRHRQERITGYGSINHTSFQVGDKT